MFHNAFLKVVLFMRWCGKAQ